MKLESKVNVLDYALNRMFVEDLQGVESEARLQVRFSGEQL